MARPMNEKCAILEGTKMEKLRFTAMEHEMNTIVNIWNYCLTLASRCFLRLFLLDGHMCA